MSWRILQGAQDSNSLYVSKHLEKFTLLTEQIIHTFKKWVYMILYV